MCFQFKNVISKECLYYITKKNREKFSLGTLSSVNTLYYEDNLNIKPTITLYKGQCYRISNY